MSEPNHLALIPAHLPEEEPQKLSIVCRMGWHSWLYLEPTQGQFERIRQLMSEGRGGLGLSEYGLSLNHVGDRLCRLCYKGEARIERFIAAVKTVRGD
jgi:hypothetical protein